MSWWRILKAEPEVIDDITDRVTAMVQAGTIQPHVAHLYERQLRAELEGKATVMRKPNIKRRFPKPRNDW